MHQQIKIGITGPESSGKTTLSKELSLRLNGFYLPEYAREYLKYIGSNYQLEDVLSISNTQINSIKNSTCNIVVCDTEALVLKIWLEDKFNYSYDLVEKSLNNNICDLYILCTPDIPWEPDNLRENPYDRERLFTKYLFYLNTLNLKYIVVSGSINERISKSLFFINNFTNTL